MTIERHPMQYAAHFIARADHPHAGRDASADVSRLRAPFNRTAEAAACIDVPTLEVDPMSAGGEA